VGLRGWVGTGSSIKNEPWRAIVTLTITSFRLRTGEPAETSFELAPDHIARRASLESARLDQQVGAESGVSKPDATASRDVKNDGSVRQNQGRVDR
jgi:hypothetical protein